MTSDYEDEFGDDDIQFCGGGSCAACASEDVEYYVTIIWDDLVSRGLHCKRCGARCSEHYTLYADGCAVHDHTEIQPPLEIAVKQSLQRLLRRRRVCDQDDEI